MGAILSGAVPVLIDPDRPVEAVKKHLLHTDSRLVILADDYQDAGSRRVLREFAFKRGIGIMDMTAYGAIDVQQAQPVKLLGKIRSRIEADDSVVILCTSGTTTDPREVELTHRNILANIRGSLETVAISSRDRLGPITPPYHSFGLTVGKLLPPGGRGDERVHR